MNPGPTPDVSRWTTLADDARSPGLAQRVVDPTALRVPEDAWRRALAATGLVVHGRRHRQR